MTLEDPEQFTNIDSNSIIIKLLTMNNIKLIEGIDRIVIETKYTKTK